MKTKLLFLAIALSLFSVVNAQIAPDANNILYVDKTAAGTGYGDSWTNALPELADALKYAKQQNSYTTENPLKIWVAGGTHKPLYSPADNNFGTDQVRGNSFLMVNNVQLYGGFAGTETTLASRDLSLTANATTLSGDIGTVDDSSDNVYQVIVSTGAVGNAKLDGFSIIGGNANNGSYIVINSINTPRDYGGGMVNFSSSPSLTNLSFSKNSANYGGGMYNYNFSQSLTNVTLSENFATYYGGGMYNVSSTLSITNGSFSKNHTTYYGGGMYNDSSSPSLTNVTFSKNTADSGGGIYNTSSSSPSLANCIIWGNSAPNGSAIFNNGGTSAPTISYSLVENVNNTASNGLDGTDANNAPQFTDADNGNVSLLAISPAIDAGSNTAYTTAGGDLQNDVDVAGNPRLFRITIDMGAFESQIVQINPAANNIIYVNKSVTGTGNGDSWANAALELSDALKYAKEQNNYTTENPLQIWVAGGTYKPLYSPADNNFGNDAGRDNSFLMVNNVQLYGGFAATETTLADRNLSLTANATTLSGDIGTVDDNSDNTYHVVVSSGDVGNALLNSFSLTDGNAYGMSNITINSDIFYNYNGGGMYTISTSPTSLSLINVTFRKNKAENDGGGMYNVSSYPILVNVTFSENKVSRYGGGIYNYDSSPILTNVTFSKNEADEGGGMYNQFSSSPNLTNCIIWGNTAYSYGNGINITGGTPTITYSLVQDINNTANNGLDGTDINNAPQFTDAANGDYSLQASSPAINVGSNSAYTTAGGDLQNDVDLAGNPRLFQETIDMGAFESQVVQITPTANILYVNKTATGIGSGDSWANAVPELADALKYAKQQDNYTTENPLQIWVVGGTYKPLYSPADNNFGNDAGRDNSFLMVDNVQLYGGFAGTETTLAARDLSLTANATTLSGDIGTVDDNSDNTYHVVVSSGDVGDALLNGFSIRGGNANGGNVYISINLNNIYSRFGGGMSNYDSSPSLTNVTFSENTTSFYGGGIFNVSSTLSLTNVTFNENTAVSGGGIYNSLSSPSLTNVTFSENTATAYGGGMYINSFSSASLANCIIWGNTATNDGNGVFNENGSTLTITYSLVQDVDNTANNGLDGTNINNAPQFTDAANGDYSLQASSPVINAGSNTAYTTAGGDLQNDVDLAGNPRLFQGTIDLGAFESQVLQLSPTNNILYVNKTATGIGSGDSWAHAASELADALIYAKEQDNYTTENPLQIWVAGGTYKPLYSPEDGANFGTDQGRDNSFLMVNNVQLYGGFAGTETTLADRDLSLAANTTTLSGDIGTVDDNSDNTYHVVISSNVVGNAKLNGFSLIDGNADGSSSIYINTNRVFRNNAGGMYNRSSSPSLTNVIFSKNTADDGGGMYNRSSSPNLINVTFSENTAGGGGGIYNYSSPNPSLTNVTFSKNTADDGGGMFNLSSSPSLVNVTFSKNTANNNGGGMRNSVNSSASLTNCIIWGNTATSDGNGIFNETGSTLTITYSLVQDINNTANNGLNGTDPSNTPQFTDADNGDLSLLASSPAINAGSNTAYTNAGGDLQNDVDLVGNPRLFQGTIDMGAFESQDLQLSPTNNILYVNKTATGTGNGDSWANATLELADALKWANLNQDPNWATTPLQIWVAGGTFKPLYSPEAGNFGNDDGRNNTFLMVKNAKLYGGFAGTESILADRDLSLSANATTLSGDTGTVDDNSDNVYHVVVSAGAVGDALLNGFSVTGGNANGINSIQVNSNNIYRSNGGGMFNEHSSPSIVNVIFNDNKADFGGGMFNTSNSTFPRLTNVSFIENKVVYQGGGMYNDNSSPNLINVTFSKNMANQGGGGISNYGSSPSLTNCIVWGNTAPYESGIYNQYSTPTITYSVVENFTDTGNNNLDGTNPTNNPQFTDAINGDLSLQASSPAINAGSNAAYTNAGGDLVNDVDLAGNPRLYNGTPATDIIDMGAYEFQGLPDGDYVYENGAWTPMDPQGNATADDNIFVINGTTSLTQALEINNITVMSGTTLNVEDVLTINGNITNNGDLVFKSTATKNGELAQVPVASTVSGAITVERYMSDNRSYRMVSSAVTTTASIHDNWQEGATSNTDNPASGYGTHITGTTTDQTNGFDATATGNPSMFTVNVATQQFQVIGNTDVNTLTAGNPYLLFVRGDRTIDLEDNEASSQTVLRATGSLVTGTNIQNFASEDAGDFVMFGNPYQSAVNVNSVFASSTNLNTGHYHIYDPTLGDYGSYVTVSLPGGTNTSGSAASHFLQPGQGAQVATAAAGASSIVFNESDKTPGEFTATNRPMLANDMLTVQLFTTENFNSGGSVHDSFGIVFADGNSNSLTLADAVKPMNFYENLGIDHNGTYLSIEQREMPQAGDEYPLYTSGYQHTNYTFKVTIDGLETTDFYLIDSFTGTRTLLETGENTYSFSVDANDPLSIATDRFTISSEQRLGVDDNNLLSGISLYPNPLNRNTFYINAPKLNGEQLSVSISDLTGRSIYEQTLDCRANTVTVPMGENIASGVYLVTLKHGGEATAFRLIKE